jgi:predicted HAD superfamily Cof-like phosphohydrolase
MHKLIGDITAMHNKYGFNAPDKPTMPPRALLEMRINFLLEEWQEFVEASGYHLPIIDYFQLNKSSKSPDPAKMLDALTDLLVVLIGTSHLIGFCQPYDTKVSLFEEAWDRVMRANMAKERGRTSRGHDMDLVKPVGWSAPDHTDLVKDWIPSA